MSRFGDDPLWFFNALYRDQDKAPWDIGAAQPAMVSLLKEYPPLEPILDVGCGSGDLSIFLAKLGHKVTGVDFVETAIMQAREKARSLPDDIALLVDFQVADALKPSLLKRRFGSVVDSGFYHLFDPAQSENYIDELALTLIPGGRYYLHAFAVEFPVANMPRQVSAEELSSRFTAERGWRILEMRPAEFQSRVAPPVPAILACIERLSAR